MEKIEVIALVPCKRHSSKIGERCNVRIVACPDRIKQADAASRLPVAPPSTDEPMCSDCDHPKSDCRCEDWIKEDDEALAQPSPAQPPAPPVDTEMRAKRQRRNSVEDVSTVFYGTDEPPSQSVESDESWEASEALCAVEGGPERCSDCPRLCDTEGPRCHDCPPLQPTSPLEPVESQPSSADLDEPWSKLPDEQTWYWHWNGEDYAVPFIHSVLASTTGGKIRYFIQYPDSRWCDEAGGWWLKIKRPNVPSRAFQAAERTELVQAAKAIAAVEAEGDGWIDVEQELPPDEGLVQTWGHTERSPKSVVNEWRQEVSRYLSGKFWTNSHIYVTKWRPLPSPPRSEPR